MPSLVSICRQNRLHKPTHSDLRTSEAGAGIQTDTVTTGAAVHLDLASIRLEVLRGVLSRDTALNGESTLRDCLLREAQLWERRASSNLDLSSDNIDTRDFLYICALDVSDSLC